MMKMKKQKAQKSVIKRKSKFQGYKNCLEAAQTENKIYHLEKNFRPPPKVRSPLDTKAPGPP